jgi:acyl-CoA thioesterase
VEQIPSPFENFLGMRLVERGPGFSKISLAYRKEVSNFHGIFHGGAIASIADTGAVQALRTLHPGPYLTAELNVKYKSASQAAEIFAEAKASHWKSKVFKTEIVIKDPAGKIVALATVKSFLPAWNPRQKTAPEDKG